MRTFITSRKWWGVVGIALLLLVWELGAFWLQQPLLLPTPRAAWIQIGQLVQTVNFWHHLGATLMRGLIGFGLAFFAGLGVGVLAGFFENVGEFFRPIIVAIRSTPVMSVIILALIWFKGDLVSIFVVFLMVFPLIVQNVISGIGAVERELIEMVKLYKVRPWRQLTRLYLPALTPFLAAGISAGLGLTWKVLIAAEVLAYPTWGIGSQLDTARTYLQTDQVFAWTLVVLVIGLSLDYFFDWVLKLPFRSWRGIKHD